MKHKALIFDLYSTLVDFSSAWTQTWAEHEAGRLESVGAHIVHLSKVLATDLSPSKIHAAEQVHNVYQQHILVPKSGAVEMLMVAYWLNPTGAPIANTTPSPIAINITSFVELLAKVT